MTYNFINKNKSINFYKALKDIKVKILYSIFHLVFNNRLGFYNQQCNREHYYTTNVIENYFALALRFNEIFTSSPTALSLKTLCQETSKSLLRIVVVALISSLLPLG